MGMSSYKAGSGPDSKSMDRRGSSYDAVNLLPTLDLGAGEGALRTQSGHQPTGSSATAATIIDNGPGSISDDPELREKEKLLLEISTIRKSIEALRSASPTTPGSTTGLDFTLATTVSPTHQTFPSTPTPGASRPTPSPASTPAGPPLLSLRHPKLPQETRPPRNPNGQSTSPNESFTGRPRLTPNSQPSTARSGPRALAGRPPLASAAGDLGWGMKGDQA